MENKESVNRATKEGCDLVFKNDESDNSIQYVSTIFPMFKVKYPANIQYKNYNLTYPILFNLKFTLPDQDVSSKFLIQILIDYMDITLDTFLDKYPNLYMEHIKKIYPNETILDSKITMLKNYKIYKMISQDDNFKFITFTLPTDRDGIFLHIQGMYTKKYESYFLPIFNKVINSFEFIK
jgi:hypothetical protein